MSTVTTTSLHVNIPVAEIEPSLPFWEAVGFTVTDSVPVDGPDGSGPLGFAIVSNGSHHFMLQSVASIEDDLEIFGGKDLTASPVLLYLTVEDIDAVANALADYPVVLPRRDTFYGATEIGYFAPDGTQVTFAQFNTQDT
ncbi:hypothetical protein GCM10017044_04040 [Kordiimonas sediminis]|uniref:VOC domain-containing protein n=1 Tax=Kordiimonas sediminis TaxID=1735581 RepID=A0A919AK44_9PROT|nr:VOC family protein [Kordiimonas sediminis]GHF13253.1 hypothetical protein GCM10017044_04040 [Kordiimonas sediminis]